MCLISACLGLCRPLGAFSVVATLPGVYTPVCGLSSLRDFRVSPLRLLFAKKADERNLKGRGRNVPRTAIILYKSVGGSSLHSGGGANTNSHKINEKAKLRTCFAFGFSDAGCCVEKCRQQRRPMQAGEKADAARCKGRCSCLCFTTLLTRG